MFYVSVGETEKQRNKENNDIGKHRILIECVRHHTWYDLI